jgi:hypothetical protein
VPSNNIVNFNIDVELKNTHFRWSKTRWPTMGCPHLKKTLKDPHACGYMHGHLIIKVLITNNNSNKISKTIATMMTTTTTTTTKMTAIAKTKEYLKHFK